jgi:hypothetical protein
MHKGIMFKIKGLSPLMLHNGQLADPLNPYTKRVKTITSKRKKTDEDYEALYKIEWEGSLYLNSDHRVVFPGQNLEAAMVEGAKKSKLGEVAKAAILCDSEPLIEYDGPKDLAKLKADLRFRDVRGTRVQNGRVMRCRPIFVPWGLSFTLEYLPDMLNESQVVDILATVGRIIGIGDFTPKYGRFTVEKATAK